MTPVIDQSTVSLILTVGISNVIILWLMVWAYKEWWPFFKKQRKRSLQHQIQLEKDQRKSLEQNSSFINDTLQHIQSIDKSNESIKIELRENNQQTRDLTHIVLSIDGFLHELKNDLIGLTKRLNRELIEELKLNKEDQKC